MIDDLLFLSRVREAASRAGVELVQAKDPAALRTAARTARLVVVDADSDRLPWRESLAVLRSDPELSQVPAVAFLSHLAAERARMAREAGIPRVLARSAFVKELPGLLETAAARSAPGGDEP
jgi:CheY-like chemotaxis protein